MDLPAEPAYGLWSLVIINSLEFISFAKPPSSRDWRSFGAFWAFLVALFTEMYGFPLTIYLLSGWLSTRFPVLVIVYVLLAQREECDAIAEYGEEYLR